MADVKRVLVTGAAGGLGGAICRSFHCAGYQVSALVTPTDLTESIRSSVAAVTVGYVQDGEAVDAAMRGADAVIHCAALLPNALHLGEPAFIEVNVTGTATVLKAAIKQRLRRAVFFSTINVVDHVNRTARRADLLDFLQNASDAYIKSKIAAEKYLLDHCDAFEGHLAVLRPAFVYGPGNYAVWREPLDLLQQGRMRLLDQGAASFPMIYAEDIARYILAMFAMAPPPNRYDLHVVSNPQPTTMRDVFNFIADYLEVPHPGSAPSRPLAYAAAVLQWLPTSLRVGQLKYLTPIRIAHYSRGYDLSQVVDHSFLQNIQLTDYRTGLAAMLDDYRATATDRPTR